MKRRQKKTDGQVINKDTDSEDWCFICKDGGDLMLCDYQDCVKVYHPACVGRKKSFIETGKQWICSKHSCSVCHSTPRFCCFCCPNAVCEYCISASEFAPVRGKKGFCKNCLKLVLLAEENIEYGSDGEKIDLDDRNTFECLFKEYWEIIKEKEGLTLDHVYLADAQLKKGKNHKCSFGSVKFGESREGDDLITSDSDIENIEFQKSMRKRKGFKAQEFVGWGSKALIEFLTSVGKDTTKQLSQYDVETIIYEYIRDRNLFHPNKKRKVVCDDKLYSIFRRKSVDRVKIYSLLESHFTENLVLSEENGSEDEDDIELEGKSEDIKIARKKGTVRSDRTFKEEAVNPIIQESCFASIVANNMNFVYLRRSLVEKFLKQPENSESKILGSFVRVKNDPRDYLQRNNFQLSQVKGIKNISAINETNSEFLLQVSNFTKDIPIHRLSDSDFTEEECEDLRQNVTNGLLRKPTVVELEKKARDLHEDITKHWIERELVRLQNYVDRANEKGWRKELCEYLDKRELLKQPSEQERLLKQVPKVIAEVLELEFGSQDLSVIRNEN